MEHVTSHHAKPRAATRRIASAFGLFLLSPLVGEFLLGNLPITALWLLPIIAPLYGCGALLIRETARRFGLGWISMLVLCLAYGIIEEAFVTQSLFNPNYLGLRLLDYGFLPQVGISAWWTVYVLGIHTIWSMAVPIALAESFTPTAATTPWLGNVGLALVAILFIVVSSGLSIVEQMSFRTSLTHYIASAVVIVGLITLAAVSGRRSMMTQSATRTPPRMGVIGGLAFLLGSAFMILAALVQSTLPAILTVPGMIALLLGGSAVLWYWSKHSAWRERHTFAVAAGLVLVYAWFGFVQVPSVATNPGLDLLGNSVFASAALVVLVVARKRVDAGTSELDQGVQVTHA